jgi:hypothetical protein
MTLPKYDILIGGEWQKSNVLEKLAGAPGFEPGNAGIKIRCLTSWLRPNISMGYR